MCIAIYILASIIHFYIYDVTLYKLHTNITILQLLPYNTGVIFDKCTTEESDLLTGLYDNANENNNKLDLMAAQGGLYICICMYGVCILYVVMYVTCVCCMHATYMPYYTHVL